MADRRGGSSIDVRPPGVGPVRRRRRLRLSRPAIAAVLVVVGLIVWWLIGVLRTAEINRDLVGAPWTLTSVSHDGAVARPQPARPYGLTLELENLAIVQEDCNYTDGPWSWTFTGFEISDPENGAIQCPFSSGGGPPDTDPLVLAGVQALYDGSLSTTVSGDTLTIENDGYTLTFTRGP